MGDLSSPSDSARIIIFLRKFGDENISRKLKYRDQHSPVATSNNVPRVKWKDDKQPGGTVKKVEISRDELFSVVPRLSDARLKVHQGAGFQKR